MLTGLIGTIIVWAIVTSNSKACEKAEDKWEKENPGKPWINHNIYDKKDVARAYAQAGWKKVVSKIK